MTVARILERAIYRGPHLYSHTPMIRARVDLGAWQDWPTNRLPGFAEALVEALPGLAGHGCSFGQPGGLLRRLNGGTRLGHVAEHVALELQSEAGAAVTRGKTRSVRGRPGVYDVLWAYEDEATGLLAGRLAFEVVEALLPPELRGVGGLDRLAPAAAEPGLDGARSAMARARRAAALGPSTAALADEARRRGIPVERLNEASLIRLGWGARQARLRATISDRSSLIAVETAGNKDLTRRMLIAGGVPVPRGRVVVDADDAVVEAARLGGAVVVKPLDANHGRGVTTGLTGADAVRRAFEGARAHSRRVVVEEMLAGRDHRILVVGGRVEAVARREPAQVVGDGTATVAELVAAVNADPRRGRGHASVLTRIRLDDAARARLEALGLDEASVPAAGEVVTLRATANLSTGGTAADCTDAIHPDNAAIARRAAAIIGLDIAGIDFIAPDIERSVRETGGGVIEVNAAPGLRMHLAPSEGRARDVARPIVAGLIAPGTRGRIPVVAITGTNGKSTTARMVTHILKQAGLMVGLTTTGGVYIGDERVHDGDATGPRSARLVLADPTVEVAVLETARGGLLREGLAFDRCDVGCVLNVAPDHLGVAGVETLEDLARVKAVVARTVARRGIAVLNADDPLVARMARRAGGRPAFFSMRGGEAMRRRLRAHVEAGGLAAVREPDGALVIHERGAREHLIDEADIPATVDGLAQFNTANALAAALCARGVGIASATVRNALVTFGSTFALNPGRLNMTDVGGRRVILDYAHNPAGVAALAELVAKLRPRYATALGLLCIPGDRRDEDIREVGAIGARTFDRLYFREEPGRRQRRPGELARLLVEGATGAGFDLARITVAPHERDAIDAALADARPGDLVVMTVTEVEESWARVHAFAREPA